MGFSVGEDVFSVLAVVGLVATFAAALVHFYHVYAERRSASEDFNLALDIAERLRDQVLIKEKGQLGLLGLSHERIENYSRTLAVQGINLRVEVGALEGGLLFAHGPEPDPRWQCFSQPVEVSLPVTVDQDLGSARMCELSVKVWRS